MTSPYFSALTETEIVLTWLLNDDGLNERASELVSLRNDIPALGNALCEMLARLAHDRSNGETSDGFVGDLFLLAMSKVDWTEVARQFLDDLPTLNPAS